MFADGKGQVVILGAALTLKGGSGTNGSVKGDIRKVAVCKSGLNIPATPGFCFGLGTTPAAAALLAVQGRFDLVRVDGISDSYWITTFPPSRAGTFKYIPCAGICWYFKIRCIRNGVC